jgi:hypothetical protein
VAFLGIQLPQALIIGKDFAKKFGGLKKPSYLCSVIGH